jgi:hypothetical protein
MNTLLMLQMFAAIVTAVTGVRSKAEIRASFGGVLIGAGIAPFLLGAPAYAMRA